MVLLQDISTKTNHIILTEDDWQKLPNALQNPFAITKYLRQA